MGTKTVVLAPMGTSPPVITEFVEYFMRRNIKITDIAIFTTKNNIVRYSTDFVRIALKIRYPDIHTDIIELDFEDTLTTEDNISFMRTIADYIVGYREKNQDPRIYLNVAGGRKNMCITLSILGQIAGVNGIYHVVNENYKSINERMNETAMKMRIEEIHRAKTEEKKIQLYKREQGKYDSLLFPDEREYSLIQIPMIPYSKKYLRKIISDIESNNIPEELINKDIISSKDVLTDINKNIIEIISKLI